MTKLELIAGLEAERNDLLSKLKSLDDTILTLKQTLSFDVSPVHVNGKGTLSKPSNSTLYDKYKSYFEAKGNKEKAIAILKGAGKFLHMRQIVKIAQSLEAGEDADTVKGRISQGMYALRNLDNSPIITKKIGASNLDVFWGSKNWVDEKGHIKPEHMYDKEELASSKSETLEI